MFHKFHGLVSPVYTPMHTDGSIAPETVAPFVEYAIKNRFVGLFVNGSTGEFTALTMAERKIIAEAYVKASAGRIPVIVNCGSCCAEDCRELAAHAVNIGAEAMCVIAPFYFPPTRARDLADFVKSIAPACEGRPLYIYHAPGMTGCHVSMVDFLKIMLDEVPNFAGVKFTNENLCEFARCIALSDRIQMMFGRDEMLLGALAMGATAGVGTTYNYLPRVYNGVLDAFNAGDLDKARSMMAIAHRAVAISGKYGLHSIKTFMKFAGIDMGPMRAPVMPISPAEEKQFRNELSEAGLDEYIG